MEPQMPWNNVQTSVQNRIPEYGISPSETIIPYHDPDTEWCLGEASSSSSQHHGNQNERRKEHAWSFPPQGALALEEHQYGQSNILSLDNNEEIPSGDQAANGSFVLRGSSSNILPRDLNMISGFADEEDEECQVVEHPNSYMSIGPSNEPVRYTGGSCSSFAMDGREDWPGCSLDGRRMSCKRKAREVHTGQSSGVGGSSCFQNGENSQWHNMPPAQVAASNTSMIMSMEDEIAANNGPEHENPRLRLGVGGAISASPFSLSSSRIAESSRRNLRLRINGLYHQDPLPENPFSTETDIGNVDASSSRFSSRLIRSHLFDLNPAPPVENGSLQGQSVPHIPSARRHHQSRWSGSSSTRSSRSSAPVIAVERNAAPFGESSSRNISRSISDHPLFIPASEMGSSSQNPTNLNLPGGNNSIAGNIASTSRASPSTGAGSSGPGWSHRSYPQYPRRLSEIVRRSLVSSAGADSRGESSNHGVRSSSPAFSEEMELSSGSEDSHGQRLLNSRSSLLDRHLDGANGMPYSLRALAAAGEGRGSIMSEIRHVLDLMRRGEGLRIEDVMILDHSVLFEMADMHDRHRDMRLDVDNMSYEELLALEERMGNVCTGLTEETIMDHLKQKNYVDGEAGDAVETEPCSICREEYKAGEDLGTLECGHDFHTDCIKQWLMLKNLCPICKTAGLNI